MKIKLIIAALLLVSSFTIIAIPNDDSYQKIQKQGKLIIGLDEAFAPMGFRDKKGEIVGFDIDLAKEVAKRLQLKAIFLPSVWSTIFLELKNGNIDLIWNGVTINEQRQTNALCSKPYMMNRMIVLVNENSKIKKLADLNGKTIAVQAGSPAIDYILKYQGANFKPKTIELIQYPDNPTALYDLIKGGVAAVAVDEIFADYYAKQQKQCFRKLPDLLAKEQYGIMFRKNDLALCTKVQAILEEMIKDGTAQTISKKWLGRNVFAKSSL